MGVVKSPRVGRGVVSAAAVCALAGQASAQVDRTWSDAVSGVFSDGGRWSPAGTPQPEDNIFIDVTGATYGVTLDSLTTVNNFQLTSVDATFNLGSFGFGTNGSFTLTNGITQGAGLGQGAVFVSGNATMSDALFQNMDQAAVLGDATMTNMFVANMNQLNIGGNGSLTLENTEFQNVGEVIVDGELIINTGPGGGLNSSIGDTCVDSRTSTSMNGDGSLDIGDGGEFNNGGLFSTSGDDNNSIEGTGKSAGRFNNNGMFVKEAVPSPLPGRGGQPSTIIGSNIEFNNFGTVQVEGGEIRFQTQIVDDNILFGGTWNVLNGQTLTFEEQGFSELQGGASVKLIGSNATFFASDGLQVIGNQSAFEIGGGRDFQTFFTFTNDGTLTIGDKSEFDADESGFSNWNNGVLTGGTYDVAGTLLTPTSHMIQFLEANVILRGENSVFDNINPLQVVGSQGSFGVVDGREFTTQDDFQVFQGGKVLVGDGSTLVVDGQLVNFSGGVFDDGFFEVAGTLQADGIAINIISNELILDGTESQFIDEQGNDALDALECIAPDGILRLRNGRTLDNLNSLKVEGILEIDPAAGRATRAEGAQVSTIGDIQITGDAQMIMHLDGTAPGLFGSVEAEGDIEFTDSALVGSRLSVIIGDGYIPRAGDMFVLMEGATLDGAFAAFDITGLDPMLDAELVYSATTLSLVITPAPGTVGALALGGVMAARRRRR